MPNEDIGQIVSFTDEGPERFIAMARLINHADVASHR